MGADSDGLCALLRLGGHSVWTTGIRHQPPRMSDLADDARTEVLDLYRRLGGSMKHQPCVRALGIGKSMTSWLSSTNCCISTAIAQSRSSHAPIVRCPGFRSLTTSGSATRGKLDV